jgi:hypothetical protein
MMIAGADFRDLRMEAAMRTFLGIVLGVIAVGVLLIAYGLLSPRAYAEPAWNGAPVATDSRDGAYQLARRMLGQDRAEVGNATSAHQVRLRCEPGQRAVVRQLAGAAEAECVEPSSIDPYSSMRTPVAYEVSEPWARPTYESYPAPRRPVRVEPSWSRDWKKTAAVIGGSTAVGAGLGAILGGKKGALIGGAIGGGASSIYEVRRR